MIHIVESEISVLDLIGRARKEDRTDKDSRLLVRVNALLVPSIRHKAISNNTFILM